MDDVDVEVVVCGLVFSVRNRRASAGDVNMEEDGKKERRNAELSLQ